MIMNSVSSVTVDKCANLLSRPFAKVDNLKKNQISYVFTSKSKLQFFVPGFTLSMQFTTLYNYRATHIR